MNLVAKWSPWGPWVAYSKDTRRERELRIGPVCIGRLTHSRITSAPDGGDRHIYEGAFPKREFYCLHLGREQPSPVLATAEECLKRLKVLK